MVENKVEKCSKKKLIDYRVEKCRKFFVHIFYSDRSYFALAGTSIGSKVRPDRGTEAVFRYPY